MTAHEGERLRGIAAAAAQRVRVAAASVPPKVWLWITLGLLGVYALAYVQFVVATLAFPFDIDQGEGYDAWSAWLLHVGQLPYTNNEHFPYYSSNYPPIWSWIVSVPMGWAGPGLAPARAVSATCALLAAVVVGFAARRRAGSNLAGLLASGLFLASPYVFHTTALARVNSAALLLALVGLLLFEPPTLRRVFWGSLALLAALFTKQTAVDAVIAAVGFALLVNRPLGIASGALIAVGGIIGLLILNVATAGAFWLNVVAANVNPFDFGQLGKYLLNFLVLHGVIVAVAAIEMMSALRRGAWSPWVFYLPLSAALAVTAGKWGAGESYFLGTIAAACVLAAGPLARVLTGGSFAQPSPSVMVVRPTEQPLAPTRLAYRSSSPTSWRGSIRVGGPTPAESGSLASTAMGAALVLQLLVMAHGPLAQLVPLLPDRGLQAEFLGSAPTDADREAGEEITELIRAAYGPALAEDPSFVIVAGKEIVGNATNLRNLYEAGKWDPSRLVADIEAHRFGIVVLNAELYPEPVLRAIGRSYYLERTIQMRAATYQIFFPGGD
jgi:hypothetical protein